MNLCSSGHDGICFEGRVCPICKLIKEHDEEMDKLLTDYKTLEDEFHNLKTSYARLESLLEDPLVNSIATTRMEEYERQSQKQKGG